MVSLLSQADWAQGRPGSARRERIDSSTPTTVLQEKRLVWSYITPLLQGPAEHEYRADKLQTPGTVRKGDHVSCLIVHGNVQVIDCCRRGTCCGGLREAKAFRCVPTPVSLVRVTPTQPVPLFHIHIHRQH